MSKNPQEVYLQTTGVLRTFPNGFEVVSFSFTFKRHVYSLEMPLKMFHFSEDNDRILYFTMDYDLTQIIVEIKL